MLMNHDASAGSQLLRPSRPTILCLTGMMTLFVLLLTSSFGITPVVAAQRATVTAKTVYVRDAQMRIIGTLVQGETFQIERPAQGGYVFGFAFGRVNKNGYVKGEYLR